ncbi:hypothetical protein DL98DRAFT_582959 [Cadophora sp. DSE1049]|nr:hypothetical protein DL98DRAFT_582959 [Cadophora sp. DSE1049]
MSDVTPNDIVEDVNTPGIPPPTPSMTSVPPIASYESLALTPQASAVPRNGSTQPRFEYPTLRDQQMDRYIRLNPSMHLNNDQFSWPMTGTQMHQSSLFSQQHDTGSLRSSEGSNIQHGAYSSAFNTPYSVPSTSAPYWPVNTEHPGFHPAMNYGRPLVQPIPVFYDDSWPLEFSAMASFEFQEHPFETSSEATTRPNTDGRGAPT